MLKLKAKLINIFNWFKKFVFEVKTPILDMNWS